MDCFLDPVKWYQNGLVKYHVLNIIILVLHLNRLKIILRVKPGATEPWRKKNILIRQNSCLQCFECIVEEQMDSFNFYHDEKF